MLRICILRCYCAREGAPWRSPGSSVGRTPAGPRHAPADLGPRSRRHHQSLTRPGWRATPELAQFPFRRVAVARARAGLARPAALLELGLACARSRSRPSSHGAGQDEPAKGCNLSWADRPYHPGGGHSSARPGSPAASPSIKLHGGLLGSPAVEAAWSDQHIWDATAALPSPGFTMASLRRAVRARASSGVSSSK